LRATSTIWNTIGFVEGHGNLNSPKEYSFVDDLTVVSADSLEYCLKQIDTDGKYTYYGTTRKVGIGSLTGINEENIPKEFSLSQNYTNPFNPSTTIKYQIPSLGNENIRSMQAVVLKAFDILGNEIATLVNQEQPAGYYQIEWNAGNLSSGIYFYRLQSGSFVQTRKLMLIK